MSAMETQSHQPVAPHKAAGLNNILNNDDRPSTNGPPLQLRDSGFYSTAEASSKHTSAASFSVNGLSPQGLDTNRRLQTRPLLRWPPTWYPKRSSRLLQAT
ncbi:hypothetical protein J3459_013664 [Metarhizium acridum]|nr:hypothetical protein J3459_013664 [Metarhizium acridum]